MLIIHADIVYSEDREHLAVHPDSYIAVEKGVVKGIWPVLPEEYKNAPCHRLRDGVLIPAFSDLHVHAPQYLNRGLEMDLLLAEWLNKCTFPMEARYVDAEFAKLAYDAFIDDMIANGTMHACVYGTIHSEATSYLLERMEQKGIKGFVGKVNMDRSARPTFWRIRQSRSARLRNFWKNTAATAIRSRYSPRDLHLHARANLSVASAGLAKSIKSACRRILLNRCGRRSRQDCFSRNARVIRRSTKEPD